MINVIFLEHAFMLSWFNDSELVELLRSGANTKLNLNNFDRTVVAGEQESGSYKTLAVWHGILEEHRRPFRCVSIVRSAIKDHCRSQFRCLL